ncbi:methyl-accepting chemotaxis protein [Sphingomonas sp.]|uniref:methyl-accepting chemotaxis protein n=1 Tax=Sphingomonas sp. TaxID=28214 RepID=UPI0025EEBA63|nr:methyl-accepting chemotaxis protein [Sphingomonas sp.]
MTLRKRLIVGFSAVIGLLAILALVSVERVQSVKGNLDQMNTINSVKQRYAINFRGSVHDRAIGVRDVTLVSDAELDGVTDTIDKLAAKYADSAGPLDAMLAPDTKPTADETRIIASIKETESKTLPLVKHVIELRRAGDIEGARRVLLGEARPMFVQWLKQINEFIDLQEAMNKHIGEQVASTTSWFSIIIGLLCVLGIGLGIAVTRWAIGGLQPLTAITEVIERLSRGDRAVTIPALDAENEVGQLARATSAFRDQLADAERAKEEQATMLVDSIGTGLAALAEGDLEARITADLAGPFAKLKTDFNEAAAALQSALRVVAEGADAIRTGTGEIATASEDLARRTEGNAASLEQTAAAVNQIDQRLKATADAASRTVQRADQAMEVVGSGRSVADDAVQAMVRVSDSAKGIDSVIEGLDKIAFQTRVLAMNAAVEAGRAGEAGRGFAVVADLVSALAMRAEEEAKRAREQLTVTQSEISVAVEAVQKVDHALVDIATDVSTVHGLLGDISTDNRAQAAAVGEITSAVSSMDRETQQNAAMVEETTAAVRNLANEAEQLAREVTRFRTGAAMAAVRRAPAAAIQVASYASPVKPLPTAAIPALVRNGSDDWQSF